MRLLATAGGLPTTIMENAAPWEWAGVLQLLSDPGQVRLIEVEGFGGNFFHASLNSVTGMIFITPHARLDHEWFTASGRAPVVDFTLRFFMADGTQALSASTFTVNVLNIDDTPPQGLTFATGGTVRAGVPGATIGRLQVNDPDTSAGFTFRLMDWDSWQFEVVGSELRLRPGVQLVLGDGPQRDIIIEVSDGRQSSAFQLSIDILPDPAVSTVPAEFLTPGLSRMGLEWVGTSGVVGVLPTWGLQDISQAGGMLRIEAASGETVLLDRPGWIDLTTGFIDYSVAGPAARAWLAYQTVFDRAPNLRQTQHIAHDMIYRGLTEDGLLHWMIHHSGEGGAGLSSADFVRMIYGNVVNWTVAESTVSFHAGRLDSGIVSRVGFVKNIMDWRTQFADFQTELAGGFFVPRPHMLQIGVLFEGGMGLRVNTDILWWFEQINQGRQTLHDLARSIASTDAFRSKWGSLSEADFLSAFYQQVTGLPFPPGDLPWWLSTMAASASGRADFMSVVANNLPLTSPFHQLPAGAMFDTVW